MNNFIAVGSSILLLFLLFKKSQKQVSAVCNINMNGCIGNIIFCQNKPNLTTIKCYIKGLSPGKHGIHCHEKGDLSEGCESTCSHYNPLKTTHGGRFGKNRHRGDFGNIFVNNFGVCEEQFDVEVNISEIVGRSIVIHEDEDDLGLGGDKESLKTGNAGKRIACGIIFSK